MRGLSEIVADNAAIEARIEAKRKASLKRLKQRIGNVTFALDPFDRRRINEAIDAWDAAERKRGVR